MRDPVTVSTGYRAMTEPVSSPGSPPAIPRVRSPEPRLPPSL
ncbi:hypothetical protein CsSME_00044425 [Camellia sinensis var. sinensis]